MYLIDKIYIPLLTIYTGCNVCYVMITCRSNLKSSNETNSIEQLHTLKNLETLDKKSN